jgi:hypothetical protein
MNMTTRRRLIVGLESLFKGYIIKSVCIQPWGMCHRQNLSRRLLDQKLLNLLSQNRGSLQRL